MVDFIVFILICIYCYEYALCNNENELNFPVSHKFKQLSAPKISSDLLLFLKYQSDSYNLKCGATGNPTPIIKWYYNRNSIKRYNNFTPISDSDAYLITQDGSLDLSNVNPAVSISYFCSATNIYGTVFSRKSEIQRFHRPKVVSIVYDSLEIRVHQKAVIDCIMKPDGLSHDFPVKHWEIKINNETPRIINKTEGRFSVINLTKVPQLHIRNFTSDDFSSMSIKCVLENKFLPNLIIATPAWTKPKESTTVYFPSNWNFRKCMGTVVSVTQGSDVELPWCSSPITESIVWFKSNSQDNTNGQEIKMNSYKYKFISPTYGNLLIKNVEVSDEGFYFVKKDDKFLKDYVQFELRVTVKISIEISNPDRFVARGVSVKFNCVVTGYPVTDIFWLHNGLYLKTVNITIRDSKPQVSVLEIKEINPDTAGVYQCVAESRIGVENRIVDFEQQSASIIINEMAPYLVSQTPMVLRNNRYATAKLESASSNVVTIQCSFNATPMTTIAWFLDDKPVLIVDSIALNVSKQKPYTSTATLRIDLAQLSSIGDKWKYGGLYVAKATNIFGTAVCQTLVFVEGVFLIRDPGKITVKHGQRWRLKCYVISSEPPEIIWFKLKDGEMVKFPETHREFESADRREILIQEVDKKLHDTTFKCNALVGGYTVTKEFNVNVAMPPLEIAFFSEEQTLNELSTIEINCHPLSVPDLPWYSWWEFHPYSSTPNNSTFILKSNVDPESNYGLIVTSRSADESKKDNNVELPKGVPSFLKSLPNILSKIIVNFNKSLHMANLTCVVQNNIGIIRKSMRITIAVIEFKVSPPAHLNVTIGESFVLNCSPKHNQLQMTIIWKNQSLQIPLYYPGIPFRIYRFPNGTLVVNNMSDGDPAELLCMINSNSTVIPISKLVKISLQVPARILPMEDNIDVVQNSNFNLTCHVYGDSFKLDIRWNKEENSVWILQRSDFKSENTKNKTTSLSLQLFHMSNDQAGRYKCEALNAYRMEYVEKVIRLDVVSVPGVASIHFHTPKVEARTIFLEWVEPSNKGNKPILGYVISWKWGNQFLEKNVTKTNVTIDKLYPNTAYNISIRARNGVGLGNEVFILLNTRQAAPEGKVIGLEAIANSSTSIVITWKPPDPSLQNGVITEYEVCHRHIETGKFSSVVLSDLVWPIYQDKQVLMRQSDNKKSDIDHVECKVVNETLRVLTDLPKFTGYAFRVGSTNAIGMGPYAYVSARTSEDFPSKAPIGVMCTKIMSTTINLQWNPPPQDSINGVLRRYKVKYFRPDYFGQELDGVNGNVSGVMLAIQFLVPYSNYSFQVAVINNIGAGPYSPPLSCTTGQGKPSAPAVVKALPYNETCVLVVWTPPSYANGSIRRYCVQVVKSERRICLETDTKQNYFKQKVCDLIPKSTYIFNVTADNNIESDATSSGSVFTTIVDNAIVTIPRHIMSTDRATIVLDCETLFDNPGIVWRHYQDQYSMINRILKNEPNGSLIILNSSRSTAGRYECRIKNNKFINYTVSVKVVPNGTPQKPEIYYHSASNNNASISWRSAVSQRADDAIISFQITVYYNDHYKMSYDVSGIARTFTITNLTCGTNYEVKLVALNRVGESIPDNLRLRTMGSKPQWANSSVLLAREYPHSLCFKLSAFGPGDGCAIDKYTVTLSASNSAGEDPRTENIDHTKVRQPCNNITNLNANSDYHYIIEASNNAGSTSTFGHGKTQQPNLSTPNINKSHSSGIVNIINDLKYYIIFAIGLIIAIICFGIGLYCKRRNKAERRQTPPKVNNNLLPSTSNNIHRGPPPSIKKRPLPDTPCNTYDSGIPHAPKITEDDDDMKPYATYAPLQTSDPLSARGPTGKKSLSHDPTPYNGGSQTHAYQYPDVIVGNNTQQPTSSLEMHTNATGAIESYDNSAKQPLIGRPLYSKGYNVGGDGRGGLSTQRTTESSCQDQYRPGCSTWSNTTGSSTKELTQLLPSNFGGDLQRGLREQDEDNCSTTRGINHSTLTKNPNNMMQTDHFNPQESYFESGSSGDDPGIQNFTGERFSGQQAIEPRFTHQALPYPRHTSSASSTFDMVDGPQHQQRFLRQETLPEEDESNNYQNKFVIV